MLAGGTGIAPMYQILQAAHKNQDISKFILLYSNKTQEDILLKKELDEMVELKKFKLEVINTLTRETNDSDWKGERGRIDDEKIKKILSSTNK